MSSRPERGDRLEFQVLRLARRALFVLAVLSVAAAAVYVRAGMATCDEGEAAAAVFDFAKVALLPLAALILAHYFRQSSAGGTD